MADFINKDDCTDWEAFTRKYCTDNEAFRRKYHSDPDEISRKYGFGTINEKDKKKSDFENFISILNQDKYK